MVITERQLNGVTILDLTGRLALDEAAAHLRQYVASLVDGNTTNIVFNMLAIIISTLC